MANEKLISANDLITAIRDDPHIDGRTFARVKEHIEEAKDVDAVEVVHGDWDVITDDCTFDVIYQCSVCKEEFVTNDGTPAEKLWHYCPNCGAKMDGDGNA